MYGSGSKMQSMHVMYTCKPEMHRHERNAHAEEQRREARKRSLVHDRCSRSVRKRDERKQEKKNEGR